MVHKYGAMAIQVGPFAYHAVLKPGSTLEGEDLTRTIAVAVCKNMERLLDTTGKWDIDPRTLF